MVQVPSQWAGKRYSQINKDQINNVSLAILVESSRALEEIRDLVIRDARVRGVVSVGAPVIRSRVTRYQVDDLASSDAARQLRVLRVQVIAPVDLAPWLDDGVDTDVSFHWHISQGPLLLARSGAVQLFEDHAGLREGHVGDIEENVLKGRDDKAVVVGEGALIHVEADAAGVGDDVACRRVPCRIHDHFAQGLAENRVDALRVVDRNT